MKLIRFYSFLLMVILFGVIQPLYAQRQSLQSPDENAWSVGANGNANITFGDIKYRDFLPNTKYGEIGWGAGISVSKYLSAKSAIKTDFNYSRIFGTKKSDTTLRSFQTNAQSVSLIYQINILQLFARNPRLNNLSFWGDIGVGLIRWQSLLYDRNTMDTLDQVYWNSSKYMSSFMIPVGLNIRYYLNKRWSLDAYAKAVFVNSDWLDAKKGGMEYDYFVSAGLGINYHFRIQKSIRNVPTKIKRRKGELPLLDYTSIDPYSDPYLSEISKTGEISKQPAEDENYNQEGNPFQVEFFVPQKANLHQFRIFVRITKKGIAGNGSFKLSLPSGFYPVKPELDWVSYTRIGYDFNFDFILPKNLDTLNIPVDITISEGQEGTYPIFLEGELTNGETYPIKMAQYVQLISGVDYNGNPDQIEKKEQETEKENLKDADLKDATTVFEESYENKIYRIQILACSKVCNSLNEFLKKHQIDQKTYVWEEGGWWRYSIYNLHSMEEAKDSLIHVRNKYGIKGAFIVEYVNGKRFVPQHQPSRSNTSYTGNNISYESNDYTENKSSPNEGLNDYNSDRKKSEQKITKKNQKESKRINPDVNSDDHINQVKDYTNSDNSTSNDNVFVYRIEIAASSATPLPLRQLQNRVANEEITEWTYEKEYRYTIGRFESEQVARAFLKYVQLQFALPDAHLVETNGRNWQRVVR